MLRKQPTMTYKDYCRTKTFKFLVTKPGCKDILNIRYIHPMFQLCVKDIIDSLTREDLLKNIKRIVIFGSTIGMACTYKSDIDIAIELKEVNKDIKNSILRALAHVNEYNNDILFVDNMNSNLKKEIKNHSTIVYENFI